MLRSVQNSQKWLNELSRKKLANMYQKCHLVHSNFWRKNSKEAKEPFSVILSMVFEFSRQKLECTK